MTINKNYFLLIVVFCLGYFLGFYNINSSNESTKNRVNSAIQKKCDSIKQVVSVKQVDKNDKSNKIKHSKKYKINGKVNTKKVKISILLDEARDLERRGNLEDLPQIIDLYEKAYLIDPGDIELLSSYSNSLIQAKDYITAKKIANICVNEDPSNELCNANITNADMFSNELDIAQKSLTNCFKNTPDNSLCHANQASLYMQTFKYKEAISEYEKLLSGELKSKLRMDKSFVLYQMALAYNSFGDHKKFKKYLSEACEMGEKYACQDMDRNQN